jgi:hypothetical protein
MKNLKDSSDFGKGIAASEIPGSHFIDTKPLAYFLKEQNKRIDQESVYFLGKLIDAELSPKALGELSWTRCREILASPDYRHLVWMALKGKQFSYEDISGFVNATQSCKFNEINNAIDGIFLASPKIELIFGNLYKFKLDSNNNQKVLEWLEKVKTVLRNIDWYENNSLCELLLFIKYIACLDNSYGSVEGFSDSLTTGLIAVGINNPIALITEEIVHESAHLFFHMLSRTVIEKSISLKNQPAFLSPFSDSPRPLSMIANGIFAYQMVLKYWEGVINGPKISAELKKDLDKDIKILGRRRINEIKARCLGGKKSILHINKNLGLKYIQIINFWTGFSEDYSKLSSGLKNISKVNLNNIIGDLECPSVTKAEVLLALLGEKISRIFLTKKDFIDLSNFCQERKGLICSHKCFVSGPSEGLGQYRNSNVLEYPLADIDYYSEAVVKAYVAQNQNLAYQSFNLDQEDNAGPLFDYPQCCVKYFLKYYSASVQKYQGDLFRYMLETSFSSGTTLKINHHCNASLEYFDLGFCWHFPCSVDCKFTTQRSKKFENILLKRNLNLWNKLHSPQIKILLDFKYGWCKLEKVKGDTIASQWLSNLRIPPINYRNIFFSDVCGDNQILLINK